MIKIKYINVLFIYIYWIHKWMQDVFYDVRIIGININQKVFVENFIGECLIFPRTSGIQEKFLRVY